jgi:hypothetical protein
MKEVIGFCLFFAIIAVSNIYLNEGSVGRKIASVDEVHLSGELIAIADDMGADKTKHKIEFYLLDDNDRKTPIVISEDEGLANVGKQVFFDGALKSNKYEGRVQEVSQKRGGGNLLEVAVEKPYELMIPKKKMLVLFIKYNSSTRTYMDMDRAQLLLNTGFKKIFEEMTDGRVKHEVVASGWHHINRDEDDGTTTLDCTLNPEEIREIAQQKSIDLTYYDNITTIANCSTYFTIGGRANLTAYDFLNIGKKQTFIKMSAKPILLAEETHNHVDGWVNFVPILVHERGHNFKLGHSNAIDCPNTTYLQDCVYIAYGNEYDKMGASDGSFVFNADQQRKAGWKNEQSEFHHVTENSTFYLNRLTEENKLNRKIGAYIYDPISGKKIFMLEYRQPHRYDNNLASWIFRRVKNGIHLYTFISSSSAERSPTLNTTPRYMDSTPTELPYHQDTAYDTLTGEYFDPIYGVGVNMNFVSSTRSNVSVYFDSDRQVCFKTKLKDWTEKPFINRYSLITEYINNEVLQPSINGGDGGGGKLIKSRERARTTRSRRRRPSSVRVAGATLRNKKSIKSRHVVLVPGDNFTLNYTSKLGDHVMCPRTNLAFKWTNSAAIEDWMIIETNDDGRPGGIDTGGGGLGYPSYNPNKYTQNYDGEHELDQMKVPSSALGSDITMNLVSEDRVTGEKIYNKIILHIRSHHNAVIPIELAPIDYKKE